MNININHYLALMYDVFTDQEQILWYNWIRLLKHFGPPPITDLTKQMRASVSGLSGQAICCPVHAQIEIKLDRAEVSVKSLLEIGPDTFMKAISQDKD